MLFMAMGFLAACSSGVDMRSARSSEVTANGITGGATSCGSSTQAVGRVYDDGSSSASGTFEARVKGLLSATVDPQYFGTISGDPSNAQTGVTIEGQLRYDSAGNVTLSQTTLKLSVLDSFVGQTDTTGTTISAYPINFSAASSGTVNLATKTFTVLFKDNYGEITLTGTIGGSTTTGTVSYKNYVSYNGGTVSSGTLGAFQIPTCAWTN